MGPQTGTTTSSQSKPEQKNGPFTFLIAPEQESHHMMKTALFSAGTASNESFLLVITTADVCFLSKELEPCPVGWGYRIHQLLLSRGVRPPPTSALDMTLNNLMVSFQ